MKVLVTGAKGQLGTDMLEKLTKAGHEPVGVDVDEMDITDEEQVEKVMHQVKPEAVVHCAAYTAVDDAESHIELARNINAKGTRYIAKVCKDLGCKLIYLSTDYVFDGQGERPWEPLDERHPLNVYGQTKYEGELAIEEFLSKYFIVRISWVFGLNGKNFVKTMLRLGKTKDQITVVDDQIGSPTYTEDLADLLVKMVDSEAYGIYHAANDGICSWYEFACEIMKQAGLSTKVAPVSSDQYPSAAKRPKNSRMNKEKLVEAGFGCLPHWTDALHRYLVQLGEIKEV